MKIAFGSRILAALSMAAIAGCKSSYGTPAADQPSSALQATIGPQGGVLSGTPGTALAGVKMIIPAGALASPTLVQISPAQTEAALPASALRVGPQFEISPSGTHLAIPAQVTLPVDDAAVSANDRFSDEVSGFAMSSGRKSQLDSDTGSVTFHLDSLDVVAAAVDAAGPEDRVQFDLHVNPKFAACLAQFPGDDSRAPGVTVTVVRGEINDSLELRGRNIKPGLKFDLFTTERSTLQADGTVDATIPNVGFAWYQSDLAANEQGRVRAAIRTILLDDIFGIDQAVALKPTNTFHVGFWFDDPQAAAACGFNPQAPTPFNGEHAAGPLAMISVPDATTALGPLCRHPDTSTVPAHCNP
jgi:hypothetical protein